MFRSILRRRYVNIRAPNRPIVTTTHPAGATAAPPSITTPSSSSAARHVPGSVAAAAARAAAKNAAVEGAAAAAASPISPGGLRGLMREYGVVAFITYSVISQVSLWSWYAAIRFGVDVSPAVALLDEVKSRWFGYDDTKHNKHNKHTNINNDAAAGESVQDRRAHGEEVMVTESEDDHLLGALTIRREGGGLITNEHHLNRTRTTAPTATTITTTATTPTTTRTKREEIEELEARGGEKPTLDPMTRFGTEFLLALAIHKVMFPVRVGLTAMTTPSIARFFKKMGWEFWKKKK